MTFHFYSGGGIEQGTGAGGEQRWWGQGTGGLCAVVPESGDGRTEKVSVAPRGWGTCPRQLSEAFQLVEVGVGWRGGGWVGERVLRWCRALGAPEEWWGLGRP